MSFHEPSPLEVLLTVAVGHLFSGVYRSAVDDLDLQGGECVLDFGSGAGTPARLMAPRLLEGGGRLTCVDISKVWIDIAQRRLSNYPHVTFHLGEIWAVDIPSASHDVVFIHYVIHDIPASERPQVIQQLVSKLKAGGKLYVREPINQISQDEIRRLMEEYGLAESTGRVRQVPLMGSAYEGIFVQMNLA